MQEMCSIFFNRDIEKPVSLRKNVLIFTYILSCQLENTSLYENYYTQPENSRQQGCEILTELYKLLMRLRIFILVAYEAVFRWQRDDPIVKLMRQFLRR